jgi:cold shock protein
MAEGKVKWFNTRKVYGFIATDDGKDIFVHYSNIESEGYKTLAEGDPVTFDVVDGEKGPRAENVKGAPQSGPPRAESAAKTESAPKAKAAPRRKPAPKAEEDAPEDEETDEDEEEAPEDEEDTEDQ